jgi:hypothetical protein
MINTSGNNAATQIAVKLWDHCKENMTNLQTMPNGHLPMIGRGHARETEEVVGNGLRPRMASGKRMLDRPLFLLKYLRASMSMTLTFSRT